MDDKYYMDFMVISMSLHIYIRINMVRPHGMIPISYIILTTAVSI